MNQSCVPVSLLVIIALATVALPSHAQAQWWSSREPVDYEDCAARAEKTTEAKQREALIAGCEAKFAGRRKPGGGYTYYDFMQDKHFDIAGPNPTAEEQREIDRHYTEFLDQHRRSLIAAAFARRQRELTEAKASADAAKGPHTTGQTRAAKPAQAPRPASAQQQAAKQPPKQTNKQTNKQPDKPVPSAPRTVVAHLPAPSAANPHASAAAPPRPAAAVPVAKQQRPKPPTRPKPNACKEPSLSCNWSRFTDGVSDMTRGLFRPAKSQAEASGPRG
ncbi:hypothetical protein [Rhodopseudomonas pseudopalustris]|uniref:hypothetical protein n=1 Tax=Rhodopseudomonas pseudopalustris TaxID=1513892 RepID=UPI003F9BC9C1